MGRTSLPPDAVSVPLAEIKLKESVQPRLETGQETVEDYTELIERQIPLPPIELDKSLESGNLRIKAFEYTIE